MTKDEVADVLDQIGTLLALKGENDFRCRAYHSASRTVSQLPGDLNEMVADGSIASVRGIGVWTVEMLLMFRLGRPDVLPIADLGVRRGFMLTYGHDEMPKPSAVLAHGECWRPYRSVASWYMWRACDLAGKKQISPT